MRAIVQRSLESAVLIDGKKIAQISKGLVLLVGIHREDTLQDAVRLADRVVGLRIFNDVDGKMSLSLKQMEPAGEILAVSNFTVYGDAAKGRRPSFGESAPYELGDSLFTAFLEELRKLDIGVASGKFGADMQVELVNDGPVTLMLDTRS